MAVSKVIVGEKTVIDLTEDTVSADTLLQGTTAHTASGEKVTGKISFITVYSGGAAPDDSLGEDGDIYLLV